MGFNTYRGEAMSMGEKPRPSPCLTRLLPGRRNVRRRKPSTNIAAVNIRRHQQRHKTLRQLDGGVRQQRRRRKTLPHRRSGFKTCQAVVWAFSGQRQPVDENHMAGWRRKNPSFRRWTQLSPRSRKFRRTQNHYAQIEKRRGQRIAVCRFGLRQSAVWAALHSVRYTTTWRRRARFGRHRPSESVLSVIQQLVAETNSWHTTTAATAACLPFWKKWRLRTVRDQIDINWLTKIFAQTPALCLNHYGLKVSVGWTEKPCRHENLINEELGAVIKLENRCCRYYQFNTINATDAIKCLGTNDNENKIIIRKTKRHIS